MASGRGFGEEDMCWSWRFGDRDWDCGRGWGLWILGRRGHVGFGQMGMGDRRRGDVGVCIRWMGSGLGEDRGSEEVWEGRGIWVVIGYVIR